MDANGNYHLWQNSLTDLPHNVLLEILSRLPLKTLLACRCVCKYFNNLASPSAYFNSLYSRRATQALVLQLQDIQTEPTPYLHMFDPEADLARGLDFLTKLRFDIPKVSDVFNLTLKNSCNGLLHLAGGYNDDPNSIIFNPLTNEYITLPRGDIGKRASRVHFQLLGFVAVSNLYKVMRIFSASMKDEQCGVQVHVVGSGLWRDVETRRCLGPLGFIGSFSNATYLNGAAYIMWYSEDSTICIYFDFDKEEIGEIELPNIDTLYGKKCIERLGGVLRDCLCVGFNVYPGNVSQRLDLWVMRNGGGDGELWSRECCIDDRAGPMFRRSFYNIRPLRVLSNRKILMFSVLDGLFCYDPSNNSMMSVGELEQGKFLLKPVNLIPSFVPLKDQLSIDQAMVQRA